MKGKVVSSSGIKCYINCPAAYKHRYETKTPERPSKTNFIGSLFHESIERFVNEKFIESFEDSVLWCIENPPVGDRVQIYRPEDVKEVQYLGKEWLKYMQDFFPATDQIYATEAAFGPPGDYLAGTEIVFESGLTIHGLIDLVYIDDDDTIVVVDYKTNANYMSEKELSYEIQAWVYALVVHKIRPNAKIRVEFWFIRHPEQGPVVWYPEDFDKIEKILLAYQNRIKEDNTAAAVMGDGCHFCSYNYACRPWSEWIRQIPISNIRKKDVEAQTKAMFSVMSINNLIHILDDLYYKFISLRTTVNEGKRILKQHMEELDLKAIGQWEITRRASTEYDPSVSGIIAAAGGVSKLTKLQKKQLEPYSSVKWGEPFIWRNWRKKPVNQHEEF